MDKPWYHIEPDPTRPAFLWDEELKELATKVGEIIKDYERDHGQITWIN